ncbi:MAG: hypothetical protein ACI89X_001533 [Planctomycetota bacterium]|jgi:hypothetical protein
MCAIKLLFPVLALAGSIIAQTSAATTVDQNGVGCQSNNGLLTGGVTASADVNASYDAGSGVLQLTIENTTPLVAGEATATITEIHFNLPPGAITSAVLIDQNGSGGAAPSFTLSFDADSSSAPNPNSIACLGDFNVTLDAGNGAHGAIANASAINVSTPNPVVGPVTFDIQLAGPGASGIEAATILASVSQGGSKQAAVGLKFQGAGIGGQESGFVGGGEECLTSVYTVGATTVGQSFDICVTGGFGCHVCLWVSAMPGPVVVGGFTVPIGLPLLGAYDLGNLGLGGAGSSLCLPVTVPNDPLLSGLTLYLANVSYNALNLTNVTFSAAFELTID